MTNFWSSTSLGELIFEGGLGNMKPPMQTVGDAGEFKQVCILQSASTKWLDFFLRVKIWGLQYCSYTPIT